MFIQKNSYLLKNDTAKNMTQNQWRSLLIVLANLLIIGGVMVFGGELVLAEDNPTVEPNNCLLPGCPIICDPIEICVPNPPPEAAPAPDLAELHPAAVQQLEIDDAEAIKKLHQGNTETLQNQPKDAN